MSRSWWLLETRTDRTFAANVGVSCEKTMLMAPAQYRQRRLSPIGGYNFLAFSLPRDSSRPSLRDLRVLRGNSSRHDRVQPASSPVRRLNLLWPKIILEIAYPLGYNYTCTNRHINPKLLAFSHQLLAKPAAPTWRLGDKNFGQRA
jgi:hypothetical protein